MKKFLCTDFNKKILIPPPPIFISNYNSIFGVEIYLNIPRCKETSWGNNVFFR